MIDSSGTYSAGPLPTARVTGGAILEPTCMAMQPSGASVRGRHSQL